MWSLMLQSSRNSTARALHHSWAHRGSGLWRAIDKMDTQTLFPENQHSTLDPFNANGTINYQWNITSVFRSNYVKQPYSRRQFGKYRVIGKVSLCRQSTRINGQAEKCGYLFEPKNTLLVCAEVFEVAKKLCTFPGEAKYDYLLAGVAYWEILCNDHLKLKEFVLFIPEQKPLYGPYLFMYQR